MVIKKYEYKMTTGASIFYARIYAVHHRYFIKMATLFNVLSLSKTAYVLSDYWNSQHWS